ncbi:FAD-dependent oxidoreductase [Nocardioides jensenii]|uniref:FAD-dependent oxidoreductase n=1 Tax=Nocardioides jensenii TaxID=1843 RepID=UPI00082F6E5B|nr:FAD-dependent oxidoreductase [Nocardioides jensenii]
MARVNVVGAGVVGLTCAIRLLEAGHRVDVLARDLPLETTSSVAAAIWYPYRALPQERVTAWSGASYAEFVGLAGDRATGVRMVTGTEVFTARKADPWWRSAVPSLDRETSLPVGYVDGWTFTTPVIEMPLYLRWLAGRVADLDGTITRLNLQALPTGADVVVNCAGLGSRHLAADKSVVPVRGQVLVVEQCGIDRWAIDDEGPTYVVPRSRDVVVGGTADEGDWSRTPSPETARDILARATRIVPELEGAKVLRHKVGLRPVRPAVRVERVDRVVHCYGHGGAGVTMSWGCADEVADLVNA